VQCRSLTSYTKNGKCEHCEGLLQTEIVNMGGALRYTYFLGKSLQHIHNWGRQYMVMLCEILTAKH